ncbi:family 20 glycosylhydrolase [Allobaculum mucilyticum]|nr:family 20 glycosylhydrolase [Allobaculum mucilyticum]
MRIRLSVWNRISKKGGNDGKNQADLTATDVFYTKEEFADYIEECKNMGITIVPEFDMPAHALAMTKVRRISRRRIRTCRT